MPNGWFRIGGMRSKLLVALLAALLLAGCTMWKERPAQTWKDATGGESLERVFWRDVKAKQWDQVEQHLAGNYVGLGPQGQFDHAAAVAHLKQLAIEDYSLGDFQVEMNTHTLVVTYSVTVRGTRSGQPMPATPMRMMSVWQKQSAGWIQIAHVVM